MLWLKAHIGHLWLPVMVVLFLSQSIYLGLRIRAGKRSDDIPGSLKAAWICFFVLFLILATFAKF